MYSEYRNRWALPGRSERASAAKLREIGADSRDASTKCGRYSPSPESHHSFLKDTPTAQSSSCRCTERICRQSESTCGNRMAPSPFRFAQVNVYLREVSRRDYVKPQV